MVYISNVRLANFKSFGHPACIPLQPFSVFIGPHAAGKSNLIDAFRFLQECIKYGVRIATTKRGGENLLRHHDAPPEEISMNIEWKWTKEAVLSRGEISFVPTSLQYSLVIGKGPEVVSESGVLSGTSDNNGWSQEVACFYRDQKQVEIWDIWQKEKVIFKTGANNRDELFVRDCFQVSLAAFMIGNAIRNWRFHKIVPGAVFCNTRYPSSHVSESGDNLISVLHSFDTKASGVTRERLLEFAQILAPQIENWKTTQREDGNITLEVQEREGNLHVPLVAISDGTIRALTLSAAMVGALESNSTVFVEEPEQGVHPFAVENLVHLMRGLSEVIQIIVTTHSPEFISYCSPEEVYLMAKVNGHTRIKPANTIEHITYYLKHFTMGELWVSRYFEETE